MSGGKKAKKFSIPKSKLRIFNDCFSVIVIIFGLYILLTPFFPNFTLWYKQWRHNDVLINQVEQSINVSPENKTTPTPVEIPDQNRIVIPRMQLNEPIYDGANPTNVDLGVWRRPHTSSPNAGGNTVMVGHRFFYSGSYGVFYHLDKLEVGDRIVVFWNKQRYDYVVEKSSIVPPTAVEIEAPTEEDILTLYTCTPLWTSKERLVVVSKHIKTNTSDNSSDKPTDETDKPAETDNQKLEESRL